MSKYLVLLVLVGCSASKEQRVKRYYSTYIEAGGRWCVTLDKVHDDVTAKRMAKNMPDIWKDMYHLSELLHDMEGEVSETELNELLPIGMRKDVDGIDQCTRFNSFRIRDSYLEPQLKHVLLDLDISLHPDERKELATYIKGL